MLCVRRVLSLGSSGLLISWALLAGGCSNANELIGPAETATGPVETLVRNVPKFSQVSVADAIDADITVGGDPSVKVEAASNLATLVDTRVEGDQLIVEFNQRVTVHGVIKVHITAPSLDSLEASGASTVSVSNLASKDDEKKFNLSVSGASHVSVDGHFGSGQLEASGSSNVKLSGFADDFSFGADGSSVIDATNLQTKVATTNASGASTIDLGNSDEIKPTASGASTIHYLGNPKITNPDASGASTISHG